MRINGSIPMHVARAYGVSVTRPVASVQASPGPSAAQPLERAGPTEPLARIEQATVPGKVNQLIAGAVPGPVTFDGSFTPVRSDTPTLQLYTRAADTIEAATGIQLGRTIDVKG